MAEGRADERFKPGVSGSPRGRPPVSAFAKLLRAAALVGAEVVVRIPAQAEASTDVLPPRVA